MSKKFPYIIIFVILVLVFAGYWFFSPDKSKKPYFGEKDNAGQTSLSAQNQETGPTLYTHPEFGFNITLPAGFGVGNFPEGEDGEMVLVQSNLSNEFYKSYSMQIYIRPFAEEGVITLRKIQSDIPNIKMQNPQDVLAGGEPAATFIDGERNTREIWFSYSGNLYQITSMPEFDNVTGSIMESWKW